MKLVVNQTKKESFLFDDDKIATVTVAYSLIQGYDKSWNFNNDIIQVREYTRIDVFVDKITGKRHLEY